MIVEGDWHIHTRAYVRISLRNKEMRYNFKHNMYAPSTPPPCAMGGWGVGVRSLFDFVSHSLFVLKLTQVLTHALLWMPNVLYDDEVF